MAGTFVVSLDFELFWGVRDVATVEKYGDAIRGVRAAIPAMLDAFARHDVHATWATVGFVFFGEKEELLRDVPRLRPEYLDARLSPYPALDGIGANEAADPLHFGRSLLERIRRAKGQEIGTHTFSHYYALERGQTAEAFRADLDAAIRVAKRLDITPRSLVWPRNQLNERYLDICRELGITSYRGNERSWMYRQRVDTKQGRVKRGARLLDAYTNMSGHNTYSLDAVRRSGPPFDLPASRFLRPWSRRLRFLEARRRERIASGLTHAARHDEVFHLWWHPHNFGTNLVENLAVLESVLLHFDSLRTRYGMRSASMGEVATELLASSSHSTQEARP